MDYKNGIDIFPKELILEIQKYISGGIVYIPQAENKRREWGEVSGCKNALNTRNSEIKQMFSEGMTIDELSVKYCLADETIKKIVYTKNRRKLSGKD